MKKSFVLAMVTACVAGISFAQGPPPRGGDFGGGRPPGPPPHQDGNFDPDRPPPPGGFGRGFGPPPEAQRLIEEVMIARMSRSLELSDEQTVRLVRVFSEHRDEMDRLNDEQRELKRTLRQLSQGKEPVEKLEETLEAMRTNEGKMLEARFKLFDEMRDGLPPEKQAKVYVFLDDFKSDIESMVHQARQRMWDRRGEGGPDADMERGWRREGRELGEEGPPPGGPRGPGGRPPGPPPEHGEGGFRSSPPQGR